MNKVTNDLYFGAKKIGAHGGEYNSLLQNSADTNHTT